jgi:two-component system, NtrC family, response regulator AtoC
MQTVLKSRRKGLVLVVEDELEVRRYLDMALKCHGYDVALAEDGLKAVDFLRDNHKSVAAVLLDVIMPLKDGIQALREIRQFNPDLPVVVISSAVSPDKIVEAMKCGATDFLAKPISHEELCTALQKALPGGWQPGPVIAPDTDETDLSSFVANGTEDAFISTVRKVAPTQVPVIIQGETGTGKEVLARYLHANSNRSDRPFLKLNCAALPSELVESELFGYDRGAFTGAFQKKAGMFELADGGTLLLDEIGDMDFKLQAKLLQVLQDKTFQHLGGKETISVDVRVFAATHRDLEQAIDAGTFREDLYYRLNVISLEIAPLRERKNRIISLANGLMRKHNPAGAAVPSFPDNLKRAMMDYEWPGNVRELENFVRKYLILRDAETMAQELMRKTLRRQAARPVVQMKPVADRDRADSPMLERVSRAKEQAETETILSVLQSTHWNRKEAAALLGIEYKALLYKMKKLCIERVVVTSKTGKDGSLTPTRVIESSETDSRPQRSFAAGSGD